MSLRFTQHKPKREEKVKQDGKQIREIEKLKKQVARLRRELNKRTEIERDVIEEPVAPAADEPQVVPSTAEKCPDCGGDLAEVDLAGRVFMICAACKYRRKAA